VDIITQGQEARKAREARPRPKANSEAKVAAMKNFLFLVLNIHRKGGNTED